MFLVGATVSGIIGLVSPFLLPFVFKLVESIAKQELTKEAKRLIITVLASLVAIIIILAQNNWTGDIKNDLLRTSELFFVNFVAIKGMVNTIYELIVKGIPSIDAELTRLSK